MRVLGVWATTIGLLLSAASASAAPRYLDRNSAEWEMLNFATCIANGRTELARQILDYPLDSPDQRQLITEKLFGQNVCAHGKMTIRSPSMLPIVGELAVAFIDDRYAKYDLAGEVVNTPPIAARNGSEILALCAVRGSSASAVNLVRADPGADAESAAMTALTPTLSACTPPGRNIQLSTATVKRLIAIVLYRYALQAEARAAAH